MSSQVFFWNLRTSRKAPTAAKLAKLLEMAGATQHVNHGDLTAIKIHFGESGVTQALSPLAMKPIVDAYLQAGARPFLTDTATLYTGTRGEAVSHALTAAHHGFDPLLTGAPVILADGLKSTNEVEVNVPGGKHFSAAYLARDIVEADQLVTVSHFKGHELAGYGGALKNAAMGIATRRGKMAQHGLLSPTAKPDKCTACGVCLEVCAHSALQLNPDGEGTEHIAVNADACAGCGACFQACAREALEIDWRTDVPVFLERMMEYATAALLGRAKPTLHINFVTGVTPHCDCAGFSDMPVCADVGVLAGWDPVAVDQAGLGLVDAAPANPGCRLPKKYVAGESKFLALYPKTPADFGLDYAQQLGLGSRKYELVRIS